MAYRIVLADPSPAVLKVIQMALPEPEYEIYVCEDGVETIRSLGQLNPDAVLLNLSLPVRDGYEVGRWLRSQETFKKTGLVFLKNAFEAADPDKLGELDYDGIVEKPFDSEKLARFIRELIDRKKGPPGLPEEALLEEIPPTGPLPPVDVHTADPGQEAGWIEEKIKAIVREEILAAERELEKRLRASLLAELRAWQEKNRPA